jgi:hypothetical protein
MPGSWDPQVYRERAQQWRHAAAALPPGETQNAYISLSKGYEDLATLIEIDGMGEKRRTALVHFQTDGEMAPNPTLLSDDRLATDGIWASGCRHPVQHRHADGRLGLLSRTTAGAQPRSDQRFVAAHCRFY